jgi:hypothetical protein
MGNRSMYPSTSGGSVGRVYAEIKLRLNGAGAPTVLSGNSLLSQTAPPTHTGGTNVIGLTMRDAWPEIITHAVDVRDDTPNGAYATLGNITNEASTAIPALPITFNVATWTAGGAAANNSSLIIVITLAIRNSNVTYGNNP